MHKNVIFGVIIAAIALPGGVVWLVVTSLSGQHTTAATDPVDGNGYIYAAAGYDEQEPIWPIPIGHRLDENKISLGEALFNDPRLSHDNTIACATCHVLSMGGTDQRVYSLGNSGALGNVNSPTVFNSGLNFRQFWDGRAETLEDQVEGPIHHPAEMGSNWPDILNKLRQDTHYIWQFNKLYPDGIQSHTIKDAIATYERSLITPNSRFDKYLRGDQQAITEEEKAGYALFKSYGCAACHQGKNVGGNMYQTFGITADYFAERGTGNKVDLGRFNVTGDERDRHTFRVPSLRLAVLTPPYLHDGSAATLEEAIGIMGRYQLGREITPGDMTLLIKFLHTLPGEYNGKPLL